jgi:2-dehydropantoate 2-reductase
VRIGVLGAGGVGGLTAGLLARGGHDVVLVARGRALDAVRARGLRVQSSLGTFTAHVEVAASPRDIAPVAAMLLAVKTWQVPEVAAALGPALGEDGFVVPLQNGVDAPDQCAAALGASRVVPGLCHMLSWIVEPGSVEHTGPAPRYTVAADPRAEPLLQALREAGADARAVDDFPAALWDKFLFLASFGGVGAITRATAGVIRSVPETRRLLATAFAEIHAVAKAKGIALRPDAAARALTFVDALPESATASLQRDIVAGRPSEIDSLSGAVARIGAAVGVDVPVHRTILAALLPQERAARGASA